MTPELFTPAWFSALVTIIVIDLVLAGDNAIVIGLAARNVPREWQRRVVLWGTAGAIVVRVLLTAVVVWLLRIPAFLLIGGSALIYIGWKLTQDNGHAAHAIKPVRSVRGVRSARSSSPTPSWGSITCWQSAAPLRVRCFW